MTKAQAALEFTLLLSFLFLLFVAFFAMIQSKLADVFEGKLRQAVVDQRNFLEREIQMAGVMEEYFQREVELPALLNGRAYNVMLRCIETSTKTGELMVRYAGEPRYESSFTLPGFVNLDSCIPGTETELNLGQVCLSKNNGQLFILHGDCP